MRKNQMKPHQRSNSVSTARKKILIVDDDVAIQEILSDFFSKRTSYIVITAEDGIIALDQLQNDPPDLILLDIIMPRLNGLAFLMDMQKLKTAKDIPVILISGMMVDDQTKKEGFELGAVEFIEKPFRMEYLLEKVQAVFERQLQ